MKSTDATNIPDEGKECSPPFHVADCKCKWSLPSSVKDSKEGEEKTGLADASTRTPHISNHIVRTGNIL